MTEENEKPEPEAEEKFELDGAHHITDQSRKAWNELIAKQKTEALSRAACDPDHPDS